MKLQPLCIHSIFIEKIGVPGYFMVSITKEKDGMLWEDMERTLEKEKMDAGKGGIWCMTRKKGKKFTALYSVLKQILRFDLRCNIYFYRHCLNIALKSFLELPRLSVLTMQYPERFF